MDPYEVLGVSRTAPDTVIKAAYRVRIREAHPDAGGDPTEAQAVNDAYESIGSPEKRARYDAETARSVAAERPAPASAPDRPATVEATPIPLYEKHEPPRTWWKAKLVWIPALILFIEAASTGGWVGAAAAAVGILMATYWSKRNALIALGLSATPILVTIGTSGTANVGDVAEAAITMLVCAVMLALWALSRRRTRRALLAHIGDVFLSTAEGYSLPTYVVDDITDDGQRFRTVHLSPVDESGEWPPPTARDDGHTSIGDYVLVHRGRIITSAPPDALTAVARDR